MMFGQPAMDYPDFDVDIGGIDIQAQKPSDGSEGMRTPPPRLPIVHEHPEFEEVVDQFAHPAEEEAAAAAAGVAAGPRPPSRRRRFVSVDEHIELTDTDIRSNLVETGDTWSVYRAKANMQTLLGRAGWAFPYFRLGSAEDNAHWMRLPSMINKQNSSPELLELFRRDIREVEAAAPKKRRVAKAEAKPERAEEVAAGVAVARLPLARAGAAAAAAIAAEEMGGVDLPSMGGSVSPRMGAEPMAPDFDFDIDLGGAPMPRHVDEEARPDEDRYREIEQPRGVSAEAEEARSVSSDRASFLGERLDIGFSPGPAESRMSIGAAVGAARAASAAAMGAPPSTSSRRSRASMLQSSAERDEARRYMVDGVSDLMLLWNTEQLLILILE
jgi:hypothetical protein